MCELFAACGKRKILLNEPLKTFFSHGETHPNGWGLATFHGEHVAVEKEPENASTSRYLKNRLRGAIEEDVCLAHIRRATVGEIKYDNCHPFVAQDNTNRSWTLIHNGTIFKTERLNAYFRRQKGSTDSERVLLYLVDQINAELERLDRDLSFDERFDVLETVVGDLSEGNKLNLIIFDGEYLYAHSNYANSLHVCSNSDCAIFSTRPLDLNVWSALPITTLRAYRAGELARIGKNHGFVFVDSPDDMQFLFMDFAGL